jgi:hypothetical protein
MPVLPVVYKTLIYRLTYSVLIADAMENGEGFETAPV